MSLRLMRKEADPLVAPALNQIDALTKLRDLGKRRFNSDPSLIIEAFSKSSSGRGQLVVGYALRFGAEVQDVNISSKGVAVVAEDEANVRLLWTHSDQNASLWIPGARMDVSSSNKAFVEELGDATGIAFPLADERWAYRVRNGITRPVALSSYDAEIFKIAGVSLNYQGSARRIIP